MPSYKQLKTKTRQSVKSTLILKPIKTNYKTWTFTVKTAKSTLMYTSKKITFNIRQKAKATSKCAECLTDKMFFW